MLEQAIEAIRKATDNYAQSLPPDGDWVPTLFVIKDGNMSAGTFEMPPNGVMRDFLFETVLPNKISPKEPDAVIVLVSAWMAPATDEEGMEKMESGEAPTPSEHPERREIVLIQGVSKEEGESGVAGEIIRSEGPPELDWELFSDWGADGFGGRIMTALRRGVWG